MNPGMSIGTWREWAPAIGALLAPVTVTLMALAAWSAAAAMGLAAQFPVAAGPLAHWLVWSTLAAISALVSYRLKSIGATRPRPF